MDGRWFRVSLTHLYEVPLLPGPGSATTRVKILIELQPLFDELPLRWFQVSAVPHHGGLSYHGG